MNSSAFERLERERSKAAAHIALAINGFRCDECNEPFFDLETFKIHGNICPGGIPS